MRKIILGALTIFMVTSLAACSDNSTSKKESETSTEQEVTYPTKKFVEGSIQIETTTYESREGWESEQETTDIKEIFDTTELIFSNDAGATVNVVESVYSGESGLSFYDITLALPDGTTNIVNFEGPSGLHGSGVFSDSLNNFFILYSESKDKKMNIGIPDFRYMFSCTDEEYTLISNNMKEFPEDISGKDLLELFNIPDATYITQNNKYTEFVLENTDPVGIGYSCLKWYYDNPYYIIIDYFENATSYNDDNAVLILDSLKWE